MNSEGIANMAMDGITSSNNASSDNAMVLVGNSNSSSNNNNQNNRASRRKALWKKRQQRKCGRKQGGRIGGRRNRRLWQLPESSIHEYTKWIQDKPEEDRTASEERFLWKCMIRSLGVVGGNNHQQGKRGRQERIREFVDRLEAKEPMELSTQEEHFVRLYHKRKHERKSHRQHQRKQERKQQKQEETTVSWMRNDETNTSNNNNNNNHKTLHQKNNRKNKNKKKNKGSGFEPGTSLESLRESMMNMGLSSDKLKQVKFSESSPMN